MLRIVDRLDDELEDLIHRVIGCCIQVHRSLGPGLRERIYARAICIELDAAGISYETERAFQVRYRERLLAEQRVDLIAAEKILVEVKAVERIAAVHQAQVLGYLHLSKLPVGLLMNFNEAILNVRRVVLTKGT